MKRTIILGLIIFLCLYLPCVSSQKNKEEIPLIKQQARLYREEGLKFQAQGNLESAKICYQKAVELDPGYADAYNDLGVIYELTGEQEKAEACYLKSLQIDPNYLNAYTNLALLYENKRELEKAFSFWDKRAKLGQEDDPWTQMAKSRAQDIKMVLEPEVAFKNQQEEEVIKMMQEVSKKKLLLQESNTALSRDYLEKAKKLYRQEKYPEALHEALNAQQLDPTDSEIIELIDKIRIRMLSK